GKERWVGSRIADAGPAGSGEATAVEDGLAPPTSHTTMSNEDKWKANKEKVAFIKQFPGLLSSWDQLTGKTVETVIELKSKAGSAVVVFTDGSFLVVPPLPSAPYDLGEALATARQSLEPQHHTAYAEHDRLVKQDKEAQKAARLSNILGAIQNNLDQIPELKDRIKNLVKEWKGAVRPRKKCSTFFPKVSSKESSP